MSGRCGRWNEIDKPLDKATEDKLKANDYPKKLQHQAHKGLLT